MQCNAARHDPRDRACAVRCAAQLLSLATLLDAKYDAVHLNAKYPQVYPSRVVRRVPTTERPLTLPSALPSAAP